MKSSSCRFIKSSLEKRGITDFTLCVGGWVRGEFIVLKILGHFHDRNCRYTFSFVLVYGVFYIFIFFSLQFMVCLYTYFFSSASL